MRREYLLCAGFLSFVGFQFGYSMWPSSEKQSTQICRSGKNVRSQRNVSLCSMSAIAPTQSIKNICTSIKIRSQIWRRVLLVCNRVLETLPK